MPRIKIDEMEYNSEELTQRGKDQLRSLQFVQSQIIRIKNEMAVYKTAQSSFIETLKAEIQAGGIQPIRIEEQEPK